MVTKRWISLAFALPLGGAAWCALGGSAVASWCPFSARTAEQIYDVVGQFSSISGVLLGFLIAALSILATIGDRQLVANMRKTGHLELLLREVFFASIAFLITLVLSLICLFLPLPYVVHVGALVVAVFVFSTGALIVAGHKFYIVLANL